MTTEQLIIIDDVRVNGIEYYIVTRQNHPPAAIRKTIRCASDNPICPTEQLLIDLCFAVINAPQDNCEWKPIGSKPISGPVLVAFHDRGGTVVREAFWQESRQRFTSANGFVVFDSVYAWRLIPPPPPAPPETPATVPPCE
jgi:hypothetical protein